MKKIKILYFTTTLAQGGAEKQLFQLICGISKKKNFEIKLISIFGGEYEKDLKKEKIDFRVLSKNKSYNLFKFILDFRTEVKKFKPTIVHSFLFHSNIVSKLSLFFMKKNFKLICSYRGLVQKYKLIKYLEYFNMGKTDLLISNSKFASDSLSIYKNILDKRKVFVNGFLPKKVNIKSAKKFKNQYKNKKIVITVGAFRFEKDYHTNVLACIEVLKKYKDVVFLYVGEDGEDSLKVKELIKKNKINQIKFLGRRSDIPELLSISDIFFFPTLFESQPNAIIEAMYYKVPIVTTDIEGITNILSKAQFSPPKDYKSMSKEILKYLNNPLSKKDLDFNHKIIVDNFSNNSMIEKYYKEYFRLLK